MSLEERYEIRSKIGQGGVGAVYRAFDRHLNREVAIKRVLADGGYENQEEATTAMLKEATALCSVNHPHIVTVFDAGVDKDGPYVVMELLSGRTIDEMIERGILTKEDFREVAVQSQEALIAAQDLDLVHRDIKPTNLMVTWLASGRFQVKLVDFGLAKFSPKPSLQTIDHGDAVFGSIHFMAPEQFERTPLDKSTDMYSLGCVYYYCLAGRYPFDGENAAQVMTAHLQNSVTPISELRPDLPKWMSDWVMWHLSRSMDNRPRDARESLQSFLMSENTPQEGTPEAPTEQIQAGTPLANPPGPAKTTVNTTTAPQPIQPPAGQAPSIHTAAQIVKAAAPSVQANRPRLLIPGQEPAPEAAPQETAPVETPAPTPEAAEPTPPTPEPTPDPVPTAPASVETPAPAANPLVIPTAAPSQAPAPEPEAVTPPPAPVETATPPATPPANPLVVPAAAQAEAPAPVTTPPPIAPPPVPAAVPSPEPIQQASPQTTVSLEGAPVQATVPLTESAPVAPVARPTEKSGMSNAVKGMIAAALVAGLVVAAFVFIGKKQESDRNKALTEITAPFKDINNPPKEVPLKKKQVQLLLDTIASSGTKEKGERETYLQALLIGESTDGTDISEMVASFAKTTSMDQGNRLKLFRLLGIRGEESALPHLIEFASTTSDDKAGQAALGATKKMANTSNFKSLLNIVTSASNTSVKGAARDVLSEAVRRSDNPGEYSSAIVGTYENTTDEDSKIALLRLMGASGGDKAASIIEEVLQGENPKMKASAAYALRFWPDDSQFQTLLDYTSTEDNDLLRKEAFRASVDFLRDEAGITDENLSGYWKEMASIATGATEQKQVIDSMISQDGAWASGILDNFMKNGDNDKIQWHAEKAKERLIERKKRSQRSKRPDSSKENEEE